MRAALLLVLATMCCALAAQDDAALITKNLTEGERALRAGRFPEAELSLKAVLELQHDHAVALAALSQAHAGRDRTNDALAAAVASIDAPKPSAGVAQAVTSRALGGRAGDVAEPGHVH